MAKSSKPALTHLVANWLAVLLVFAALASTADAKSSSPRPITDAEIREKKSTCYADIDRSSKIAMENCALRCLSPVCYALIYESDPLEDGEMDYVRGQEYKYCMHKESLGESLQGVKGSFSY